MNGWILLPVFLPVLLGACMLGSLIVSGRKKQPDHDAAACGRLHLVTCGVLFVSAILALCAAWSGEHEVTLFYLMKDIPVYFRIDDVSRLFVTVISIVWVAVAVYSCVYMRHEGSETRFFAFYLMAYGVLVALSFSGNLVTMYLFYELMTLISMPMVFHNGSHEAIMAALKYLFYSMCGAYMGLFGIYFLYQYTDSLTFTAGGTLDPARVAGHEGILLIAVFVMLIGFGAKAGMFPLHAWLPTAHPVAPSPASAVLSGVIVKGGVLAIIRTVYYVVGTDFLRGTWVQTAWIILTLLTVFMGSLLAYRENVLKKRLAYSTVSQISYILFGLALLTPTAMTGALLHVVFHAFIKVALFLTAGIFIFCCNKTRVEELTGIGKQMSGTLWCFTFASLALIGIPPASGFISKWYLAQGALEAPVGVLRWIGPAVLLLSALLTAGYLLPVVLRGFLSAEDRRTGFAQGNAAACVSGGDKISDTQLTADGTDRKDAGVCRIQVPRGMLIPLAVLAALTILSGVFPNVLISFAGKIAAAVM